MKISYLVAYSLVFFSSLAALVLAGTCTCTGNSCTVIQVSTDIPDEDACETFGKTDDGCNEDGKAEWSDEDCFMGSVLSHARLRWEMQWVP